MCISSISNIKLTVTYTVPPPGNPDDPTKPQAKHLCHQHPFMSANTHLCQPTPILTPMPE